MIPRFIALLPLLPLVFAPTLVRAQEEEEQEQEARPAEEEKEPGRNCDFEGAHDHPAIKRYPNSFIAEFKETEFEEANFPVANDKLEHAEGKYLNLVYFYPPKTSCTQILRNYKNAFEAQRLKVFSGNDLPEESAINGYYGTRWVTAIGPAKGGGKVYVGLNCDDDHGNNQRGGAAGVLVVVETKPMEQKIEVTSDFLAEEIEKSGRVALYGITFATGKAEISPDSAQTLEQIGKLLSAKADWKLRVEGHTDNVGPAKANLELSRKRAQAVKEWLVAKHKIDARRLTAEGFGDSKPIGDNTTDEGKAKNRRVELVKL